MRKLTQVHSRQFRKTDTYWTAPITFGRERRQAWSLNHSSALTPFLSYLPQSQSKLLGLQWNTTLPRTGLSGACLLGTVLKNEVAQLLCLRRVLATQMWLILCVHLTGLMEAQIAGCVCVAVTTRLSKEDLPSPVWAGVIQSVEGPNRTKRLRKGKFSPSLLELGCPFSPALGHRRTQEPWVWGPWDSRTYTSIPLFPSSFSGLWPQTGSYIISFPSFQTFGLGLNVTTGFPGSPACRRHIMAYFSLRNQVSQSS